MPRFTFESLIDAPPAAVFAFHERPDALEKLTPPFPPARVVSKSGGIEPGAEVILELGFFPFRQRWVARHVEYEKDRLFVDVQVTGPFHKWIHRHEFHPAPAGRTLLRDNIEFSLKGGALVDIMGAWAVRLMLTRMFRFRHQVTAREL